MVAISFQMKGGKCSWQNPFCNSTGPEPLRHKSPGAMLKEAARCWQRQEGNGRDLLGYESLFNSLTERLILKITIPLHLAGM